MKKLILGVVFFLNLLNCAKAQDSVIIKKIVDETLLNSTAYSNLRVLCKQVGQRLSGSQNFNKAILLVEKMMKDAGADTVYLQPCLIPHWVRGAKETGSIQLNSGKKYDLHLCALGTSVATLPSGLTAPVIEITSMSQLNELGTAGIKGKIVFFNFRMNPTYVQTFRAYGESGISRTKGPGMASKYGAVGVLVRSLAINLNNCPHTGGTRYNDSFPKIQAVAISTLHAESISSALTTGPVKNATFKTSCKNLPRVTCNKGIWQ